MEIWQGRHEAGQGNSQSKEQGKPSPGFPNSQPDQKAAKNPENQALPNAWELLERKARRFDQCVLSRMSQEEYDREGHELERLKKEIDKNGPDRDKNILALLFYTRPRLGISPAGRHISELERIQGWRSEVEPLSDEDIAECAHRQKEEKEAFRMGEIAIFSFHPSIGDGELILAKYIDKEGEMG